MRCLIVNPGYRPATGAITERVVDLAEHLAAAGHDVEVLCWNDAARAPLRQTVKGVDVSRLQGGGLVLLGRLMRAALSARFDADIVLTVAPPMPLSWFGRLHALARGSKHVVWVMDLETDRTRDERRPWASWLRRVGKALLFAPMRKAALVLSIGRCMRDTLVANGIAPANIKIAPLWSNRTQIAPIDRAASFFARDPELRDKFVIMYSGRAARYHEVATVCEAMRLLRDDGDVAFVFAASDVGAAEVEQYAAAHGLTNYYKRGNVPLEDLCAFLGGADAHLVTLKDEMLGTCVPSKTYGALAAARPVVFIGPERCEAAINVAEHDAGRVVRTGDADALVRQVREWKDRGPSYRQACENALRAFNSAHCVEIGCSEIEDVLLRLLDQPTRAETPHSRSERSGSKAPVRA